MYKNKSNIRVSNNLNQQKSDCSDNLNSIFQKLTILESFLLEIFHQFIGNIKKNKNSTYLVRLQHGKTFLLQFYTSGTAYTQFKQY